ncbi:hypothetical protein [Pontibacter sp. G13]|uniref:hypothetical protein n=1 Tax=Pontibacter sp. G13 TaxID=3074898 RepID=UPI00288B14DB|nr:hypothetical protein [Pontibacter sp. G13]WNJ19827.1 hypothetical protein RJD25_05030 [Pontibacter sp. G13]
MNSFLYQIKFHFWACPRELGKHEVSWQWVRGVACCMGSLALRPRPCRSQEERDEAKIYLSPHRVFQYLGPLPRSRHSALSRLRRPSAPWIDSFNKQERISKRDCTNCQENTAIGKAGKFGKVPIRHFLGESDFVSGKTAQSSSQSEKTDGLFVCSVIVF